MKQQLLFAGPGHIGEVKTILSSTSSEPGVVVCGGVDQLMAGSAISVGVEDGTIRVCDNCSHKQPQG